MANISFRRAWPEDKEAILNLLGPNPHDGQDHLPAFYDYIQNSPNAFPAVLLSNGRIIAFIFFKLADNGKTAHLTAARVHADFDGKGLMNYLGICAGKVAKRMGAQTIVFSEEDTNRHVSKYASNPSTNTTTNLILIEAGPLYHRFDGRNISFSTDDFRSVRNLAEVFDGQLPSYFQSTKLASYIAPEGRLTVNFSPFKVMTANIPLFRPSEHVAYTVIFSNITTNDVGKYRGLLSFGTMFNIQSSDIKYMLDLHGSDIDSLKIHLIKHLMVIKDKAEGQARLQIFIPKEIDVSEVDSILNSYGIERPLHTSWSPEIKCQRHFFFEWRAVHFNML